jgi:hypothetical protein
MAPLHAGMSGVFSRINSSHRAASGGGGQRLIFKHFTKPVVLVHKCAMQHDYVFRRVDGGNLIRGLSQKTSHVWKSSSTKGAAVSPVRSELTRILN